MMNVGPSLNQPKAERNEASKESEREKEPTVLWRKPNKERRDWQGAES